MNANFLNTETQVAFCRTCLSTKQPLYEMDTEVMRTLENCTSIKINNVPTHVKMICLTCKRVIDDFNLLKARSNEIDIILRKKHMLPKIEQDDIVVKCEIDPTNQLFDDEWEQVKVTCEICHTNFKDFTVLQQHKNLMHSDENTSPHKKSEELDTKSYMSDDEVNNDSNDDINNENSEHKCLHCLKTFQSKDELIDHKEQDHPRPSHKTCACVICSKIFAGHRGLLRHWLSQHKNKPVPFTCKICDSQFCDKLVFDNHVAIYHIPIKIPESLQCPYCEKKLYSKRGVRRHIKNRHISKLEDAELEIKPEVDGVNQSHLACKKCATSFADKFAFVAHLKQKHPRPSTTPMSCIVCGKEFSGHRGLLRHWLGSHENEPPFRCEKCCRPFCVEKVLENHLTLFHHEIEVPESLKCSQCNKTFQTRRSIRRHIESAHMDATPAKCPDCDKVCKSAKKMQMHRRRHSISTSSLCAYCGLKFKMIVAHMRRCQLKNNRVAYRCRFCKTEFDNMAVLRAHHRQIHKRDIVNEERNHECKLCGKKFPHRTYLNSHLRSHKESRPFKCSVCPKEFKRSWHLRSHMLGHMDQKPHACEICDKRFREKSKLTRHMRLHSGEKPFVCELCPATFDRSDKLKLHVSKHNDVKNVAPPLI